MADGKERVGSTLHVRQIRRGVEGQLASLCGLWAANCWARHTRNINGLFAGRVPLLIDGSDLGITVVGARVSNAETLPDVIAVLGASLDGRGFFGFFGFFGRQQGGRPRLGPLFRFVFPHVSPQAPKRPLSEILTTTPFTSQKGRCPTPERTGPRTPATKNRM